MNGSSHGRREGAASPPRPARESVAARRLRAAAIATRLATAHPGAECSLAFENPFQLLVATILSAQCTDKRVNMVTGDLFRRWPTPAALAAARPRDLEAVIRSTGFYRAKAKNILGCCRGLVERHGGQVPPSLPDLVKLPGVGRKTANVVLGSAFGEAEGIVVDTHVGRIARRLGLTRHADAVRAERDLVKVVPRDHWIAFSHRLIEHGRTICPARGPRCDVCPLADLCPRVGVKTKEPRKRAARRPSPTAKRRRP
ncbi:MAG: endonuclease III [Planctomycetia bacterium]